MRCSDGMLTAGRNASNHVIMRDKAVVLGCPNVKLFSEDTSVVIQRFKELNLNMIRESGKKLQPGS